VIKPNERLFEDAITQHLVEFGGYLNCKWGNRPEWTGDFDAAMGIDTSELFAFIEATQTKMWTGLEQPFRWHKCCCIPGRPHRSASARLARSIRTAP